MNTENKGRRQFISRTIKAAGATAFLSLPKFSVAKNISIVKKEYTVQDVMGIILKEIPGAPFAKTVDTIKSGSASNKVSGIVTTMFATVKVIEEAAKLNANFIIAHEPTFYNHEDDINFVANNEIVKEKQALLQKHNITVWRFHDGWHAYKPDGILHGVLKNTNWLQYYEPGKRVIKIPAMSFENVIAHLKSSLGIEHLRVIGNMNQMCERIVIIPGAAGGETQIGIVEKEKPDILIVGELREWETAEYIRDGQLLGAKTSLIVLGHSQSEEPGMEWLVDWLQPKVPELKITHIASGNSFSWA
ncbi:MAG TPA: Nif3-like dinuclear metal center hexameric protein [Puia sp.]|nr:Nif3-like dinuclear metal center hexameric protein [Puia sp.]